jgi:threonine dehydratase
MEVFQRETGARYISPFGESAVVAGQGTVGLEILEDFPEVDHIVVGVGGGGLAAGVAVAVKSSQAGRQDHGVEPEGAPTLTRALAAGEPVRLGHIETIADGLSAPYTSPVPFQIIQGLLDDVVIVSDSD